MNIASTFDTLQSRIIPLISIAWCTIVITDQFLGNVFGFSFIYDEWASMTIITSGLFIILFYTRMIKSSKTKITLFKIVGVFALLDFIFGLIYEDRTYISSLATSGLFLLLSVNGFYQEKKEKVYLQFGLKFLVYVTSNVVLIFYFLEPSQLYTFPGFESVSWNTATGFLLYASTLLSGYYGKLIDNSKLPKGFKILNNNYINIWFSISFFFPVFVIFSISILYFLDFFTTKTGMAMGLFFVCLIPFPLTYFIYLNTVDWSTLIYRKNKKLFHREQDLKFHNELLEEFAQITSHNLRGPIVGLKNLTELILKEDMSKQLEKKSYRLIDDKLNSLTHVVEGLAEFYNMIKIGEVKYQKCEIKRYFEQAITMCQNEYGQDINNGKVKIDYDLEVETVEYPKVYFESIAYNLVSNSFKYRNKNRQLVLKLNTSIMNDQCTELTYRDNGLGMDLEYFGNKIFKFGESFHNDTESGGIGLFIIKSQLARLGDTINVKSEEGKFTEFNIKLNQNGKKELGYSG